MSQTLAAGGADLSAFGRDPWWLMLIKVVVVFAFLVVLTILQIWAERRVLGRMQQRPGPNRAGPLGLLQSVGDALKLMFKGDFTPSGVDKLVYVIAPAFSAVPALVSFTVIPIGPTVSMFGHKTPLQVTDLPVAVLLVLSMASMGVYGIVLAGWASRSPFAILGGLRSSAQVISYEIAMGLSFVAVFLYSGTMSTSGIVAAQHDWWFGVILFPSFLIYVITMFGETNRLPFDLPEGGGELVGGFHTEYASMKFAMFYLAEYINMATVSGLSVTLFLGGWRAPWPLSLWEGANQGWWPVLWFLAKFVLVILFFYWVRSAVPRIRYDQLMALGWKILIPVSLAWILFVATIRGLRNEGASTTVTIIAGVVLVVIMLAILLAFDAARERRAKAEQAQDEAERKALADDPMFAGYPVPPMDAPHYGAKSKRAKEGTNA
ncbi:MAG TPA: NADH-quinone oxidoreductase subunit NuoH [Streptosporangiaceae bacterium]